MRLRTLGAVCASCAVAASTPAVAQSPTPLDWPVATPPTEDPQQAAKQRLIERHLFLARRLGRLRDDPLSRSERRRKRDHLHSMELSDLRASTRELRREVRRARARRFGGAPNVPIPPVLDAIAECESHDNPRAISPGGTYRGKYQFSFSTWQSVGGDGDPAAASETEQDRRAAVLYRTGGPGHWPVCGR